MLQTLILFFMLKSENFHISTPIVPGVKGLPVGSNGTAALLISGGIDGQQDG